MDTTTAIYLESEWSVTESYKNPSTHSNHPSTNTRFDSNRHGFRIIWQHPQQIPSFHAMPCTYKYVPTTTLPTWYRHFTIIIISIVLTSKTIRCILLCSALLLRYVIFSTHSDYRLRCHRCHCHRCCRATDKRGGCNNGSQTPSNKNAGKSRKIQYYKPIKFS